MSKSAVEYLGDAMESLKSAASAMAADGSYSAYVGRVEKATSFMGLIFKELEQDPNLKNAVASVAVEGTGEAGGESASAGEAPSSFILPVDEILSPVSEEEPGGDDCRLSGEFNQLLSLVVNRTRAAEFSPQWGDAAKMAIEILKTKSKDLGVVVRLIEAAFISDGFPVMADGLVIINRLLEEYWLTLFPEYDEYDFEPRANAIMSLQELLMRQTIIKYGEAHLYSPSYANRAEADREKQILDTIVQQLDKLDKFTYENFGDDAPDINDLKKDYKTFHNKMMEVYKVFVEQDKSAAAAEASAVENMLQADLDKAEDDERRANLPKITKEPEDLKDTIERLHDCVNFLLENKPDDVLPYALNRILYWYSTLFFGSSESPKADDKQKVLELVASEQWKDLIKQCELTFKNGGHHWLDLQRYIAVASEKLGGKYNAVGEMVSDFAGDYSAKKPMLLDVKLPDSTPAASAETNEWIKDQQKSKGGGGGGGDEDLYSETIAEATALAQKGSLGEAIKMLADAAKSAKSGRESYYWRLHTVEFCITTGQAKTAIPYVEKLVEDVLKDDVSNWENSDFISRVYKAGYDCYINAFGVQQAPKEKVDYFYNLICSVNPGAFLKK